jgi:hypothetical protein
VVIRRLSGLNGLLRDDSKAILNSDLRVRVRKAVTHLGFLIALT